LHSIHYYTADKGHYENATAPLAAERFIEVTSGLIDLSLYENGIVDARKRPGIAFDEWNVWDPMRAIGSLGGEENALWAMHWQ
jgi:alpha-L-arabinofuranosidase